MAQALVGVGSEPAKDKDCPSCSRHGLQWIAIRGGSTGEIGYWCPQCKKSFDPVNMSIVDDGSSQPLASTAQKQAALFCPACGKSDIYEAPVDGGALGPWCRDCNKSFQAMGFGASAAQATISQPSAAQAQQSSGIPGWLWFILIYGIGNLILYNTTGILLLPIPRK